MAPRMTRRLSASAAVLLITGLMVVGPAAADACATHINARLDGFFNGRQDLPYYYWTPENLDAGIVLNAFGHNCTGDPTSVKWSTLGGSATGGEDFTSVSNKNVNLGGLSFDGDESFADDTVNVISNSTIEPAVETLTVKLTGGEANLNHPSPIEAPVHLIDDDGTARAGFAAGPATTIKELDGHFALNPDIQIPVFRAGNDTSTSVTVTYSIAPTSDDAFTDLTGGSVTVPAGQRHATIKLGINRDDDGTDETLTITLTGASGGATLAENTTATVNIDDNYAPGSDTTAPTTSFHHPKHLVTYKFGSAKARTIHIYGHPDPSGIVDSSVDSALKRTMKSGSCKWWTGSAWVNDGCADSNRNDHWLNTKFLYIFNGKRLFEHYLKKNLPRSVGTTTKFFHVYSTATDGAGNADDQIDLGRNKNKFEIK